MKTCRVCSCPKPESDFYVRENDNLRRECKECLCRLARERLTPEGREKGNRRAKENYERTKLSRSEYNAQRNQEKRDYVNGIKAKAVCVDCHESFAPVCLDFDHLPQFKKTESIARMVNGTYTLKSLKEELTKCEIVCACCHRLRTSYRTEGK